MQHGYKVRPVVPVGPIRDVFELEMSAISSITKSIELKGNVSIKPNIPGSERPNSIESLRFDNVKTIKQCFELLVFCQDKLKQLTIGGLNGTDEFAWLADLPKLESLIILDDIGTGM